MITKEKKFKRGNSSENLFLVIILATLFFAVIGFLVVANFRINQKRAELRTQIERLTKEIELLEGKKEKLTAGILESETEDYLEKEAREQLGLKKPGEEVVVVLPPEKALEGETKEKKSFWQQILEIFGF